MKLKTKFYTIQAFAVLLLNVGTAAAQSSGGTDNYDAAGKIGTLIGGIVGAFFLIRSFLKKK